VREKPELFKQMKKIRFQVSDTPNENLPLLRPDTATGRILFVGIPAWDLAKDAKISLCPVTTAEEMTAALKEEYLFAIVDPYLGYREEEQKNLCVNDMVSGGMQLFRELLHREPELPIYILDKTNGFSDTDRESFALDGATGCMQPGDTEDTFAEALVQIAQKHYIAATHEDFCNRGYCLDFTSRQIMDGSRLTVEFYNLKRRNVPDAESARMMVVEAERPRTTLQEVIGAEEAKQELQYFVNYLKDPGDFLATGQRPPKGLLLYGQPGTGKTMMARALAGETEAAFISTSAAELLSRYQGDGEAKVRQIFATARRYAPAIIFIDEIDAIGQVRTGDSNNSGRESILNTLLVEMDGFKTNRKKPVFVLAATNFGMKAGDKKAKLDPALLRRFDNQIYVDLPKEKERKQYLELCRTKDGNAKLSDDAIANIAGRSVGKSIAQLENVYQMAVRNAARAGQKVTDEILLDAYEQAQYGLKKEQTEEYFRETAIHEAGHAYIAHLSGNTPAFVTVTGRADFAGYVAPAVNESKVTYTEEEFRWMIREKLAGRAAEKVLLGTKASLNTGSSSDIAQATEQAIRMVTQFGFVENQMLALPYDYVDKFGLPQSYLDMANTILLEEQKACEKLVEEGKEQILLLVDALLKNNQLMTAEIRQILDESNHAVKS
jgi:ATP-dependent Zn protease